MTTHTTTPRALLDSAISSPASRSSESPAAILKRETARAKREHWELTLLAQIRALHLPEPTRQYAFHPLRRYRADFAYVPERLLIEVDGGIWLDKGGHTTGAGYQRDRERDCEAVSLGYTVLRVTPAMVKSGKAVAYVETALRAIWQAKRGAA